MSTSRELTRHSSYIQYGTQLSGEALLAGCLPPRGAPGRGPARRSRASTLQLGERASIDREFETREDQDAVADTRLSCNLSWPATKHCCAPSTPNAFASCWLHHGYTWLYHGYQGCNAAPAGTASKDHLMGGWVGSNPDRSALGDPPTHCLRKSRPPRSRGRRAPRRCLPPSTCPSRCGPSCRQNIL